MAKKKSNLHQIDIGTVYDVPANMTRIAKAMTDGMYEEDARITDAVVVVRCYTADGNTGTRIHHLGTGTKETAVYMLEVARNRFIRG